MGNNYSLFTSDWNDIKKIQQLSLFGSFEEVLIKGRVIPAECV